MKKYFTLSILIMLMVLFLVSCTTSQSIKINKEVEFKEFYAQVIGFSESEGKLKPIQQDVKLMLTNDEFHKFKNEYFTPKQIPIEEPNKEKAVIFLQIPSKDCYVDVYSVKSINIENDTLVVNLNKSGSAIVDAVNGFNGIWKWVIFLEINKTDLKDNMEVITKK